MRIVIDYDNDCVRFGHNRDMDENIEKKIIIVRGFTSQSIKMARSLVEEMVNMICDGNEHIPISIEQQSDGELTIIEEY